jgi:hypothetical protein
VRQDHLVDGGCEVLRVIWAQLWDEPALAARVDRGRRRAQARRASAARGRRPTHIPSRDPHALRRSAGVSTIRSRNSGSVSSQHERIDERPEAIGARGSVVVGEGVSRWGQGPRSGPRPPSAPGPVSPRSPS